MPTHRGLPMQPKSAQSNSDRGAPGPASRVGIALVALAVGAGFALDTWARGWTGPGVAAIAVALVAAGCAAVGGATRRPSLERAARLLAVAALVVALAAVASHLRG
jgi:hypothetical protein